MKQPYFIQVKDMAVFSFVGLRSSWQGPDGTLESCAIITTAAKGELVYIHDRMPAIIGLNHYGTWLEADGQELLRPCTAEMKAYPVSRQVNNPRNQGRCWFSRLAENTGNGVFGAGYPTIQSNESTGVLRHTSRLVVWSNLNRLMGAVNVKP